MIIHAACYLQPDRYNPTLRATVPGAWLVEFDAPIPGHGNVAPVFVGETRSAAIRNAVEALKNRGLTGSICLHA